MAVLPKNDQLFQSSLTGIRLLQGGRKVATGLRNKRKGLILSPGRLLPVVLIASLILFIPSVIMPSALSTANAAGPFSITYSPGTYSGATSATGTQTNGPTSIAGTGTAEGTCWFSAPAPTYAVPAGYSFLYWAKSGATPTFVVGARVPASGCISNAYNLTAKWAANKYVFTSTTSAESSTAIYAGTSLKARSSGFTAPDFPSIFGGWCTVNVAQGETCTGTTYTAGSTLPVPESLNVSLWAIWIPIYTITYDENGGEPFQPDGDTHYNAGSEFFVGGEIPSRTGYSFDGWFTDAEQGQFIRKDAGNFLVLPPYGDVTYYAHWKSSDAVLAGLTLSSGTLSPSFASGDLSYQASVINSVSSITVTPTVAQANAKVQIHYTDFTSESDVTLDISSGAATGPIPLALGPDNIIQILVSSEDGTTTRTYTVNVTRATQNNNPGNYTITWNNQGATTTSRGGSTSYASGSAVAAIPTTAPQKTGSTFAGWFTGPTSGTQITDGSFTQASPYGNLTFYAHWSANKSSSFGTWTWTNQLSAGRANWHGLAASADGSKLFAGVDGGSLYRSTDFGVTWTPITGATSGKNWNSIATNIDGTKVAAVDFGPNSNTGGDIWTSSDSGLTWSSHRVNNSARKWDSIASSSNGTKLVAVSGDGHIATSSNSGVDWTDYFPNGSLGFTGVSSSNDGTYLAATTWANGIYTSSDSGQTWTSRTLPVPNAASPTHLQAIASSGDGSRLVTGTRVTGSSNGGIIFTSADYGVSWSAYAQNGYDYINFVSNGDGSRLASAIYGQAGVSTSADYGATWTFQSVGLSGEIPIASNIDGSLLFVGAYGGNLWTGKVPNARVVAVLPSSTSANLGASANTPATALTFSASSAAAALTVTPIANPATEAATPFNVSQASLFDISVVNVTGQVTICVDGGPNVRLWHYTNGAWVDVTTTQSATQTCGLTSSFSPFATAPIASAALVSSTAAADAAAKAAAEAAAAKREAEKQAARADITSKLKSAKDLTVDSFAKAEIPGITPTNIAAVQAELLALPEATRTDINQVLKIAHKYEVVGNIGSDQINYMQSNSFVEIGLIPATSKNKVALVAAVKKLPAASRDTYAEIKAAIDATIKEIQVRSDRLAAIISRNASRNSK